MAAERTLVVRLKAEYRGFEANMKAAARAAEQASEKIDKSGKKSSSALGQLLNDAKNHEKSWEIAGGAMLGFGAAVVGMVGLSVAKYAAFDKAMSRVQAATHASTGDMERLREAAINAGADTAFSAEEAAQGIEELSKAGVSTANILNGGLNGALALAAAGELAVADAAEIAAAAMTQFKLEGDQIPHLADLLAAGAGKAQGSVQDLGAALGQSGLVAASTGLTIEETTGALTAFADAGLTGSDAGTSFKSMLQRLTPQSSVARKEMERLGISAYDAEGSFIGMSEFAGVLQDAFKGVDDESRNASMGIIFGSDAVRASTILYEQGAEGIQAWEEQVNSAGYAAQTAAIMQDNLAGDIEKLGGAFDTVFIKSGKGVNDGLRGLTQGAEGLVDMLGKIPGPVLSSITAFAGIVGATALAGGAFMTLAPKAIETWGAFRSLGTEGSKIPGTLGKVTKAAGLAAGAFVLLQGAVAIHNALSAPEIKGVEQFIQDYNKLREASIDLDDTFKNMEFADGSRLEGEIGNLGDALGRLSPKFGDVRGHLQSFGATALGVENGLPAMRREIEGLSDAMATAVSGGDIEGAAKVFSQMVESAEAGGKGLSDLTPYMDSYLDSLRNVASQAGVVVSENELMTWAMDGVAPVSVRAAQGIESTASAMEEIGLTADGAVESLDKFLESLFALSDGTLSVRSANRDFQESIDSVTESITKNGKSLDENTPKGRANQAALDAVAQSGKDVAMAMATAKDANGEFAYTQEEVQTSLKGTYDATYAAARQFGLGKEAAGDMARELLGIPKDVSVDTWISEQAEAGAKAAKEAIEAIPGYTQVSIAVTEDGTVGQVQSKINEVTGKTEFIFVDDEGTVSNVQQRIINVDGVERVIYVDDNGTVITTQGKINGVKDGSATINVSADGINNVQSSINSIKGKSVTISVGYSNPGSPISFDSLIPKRASGGSIFGPGTETSDSIPAWLSTNEHVLSAKEVRGLGGHGAVERLRAEARAGSAPAFKDGGAVGRAESKVSSTKRAYDRISGDKANRLRKLAAKDQYDAAKAELAAVKKSSKASADAAKEEKERQSRLSDSRRELRTDLRRGDIVDSFTSGSGLSQIDKLGDASRNKDYSATKRKGLARDEKALEKSLTILTKKSEGLKTALEAATSQADELRSVRDSVAGDLRGEFSLSGMLSTTRQDLGANPFTAKGISGAANKMARRIEIFAGRLNRLRKMGYGETIIQEVAGLGTEDGITVAGVLMNATQGEKSSIVGAYKRLDTASGQAGQYVTESMYKGGLDAADGLVNGLQSKTKTVENAFYKLGKDAEKSFKRSLGIKSPSTVMFGAGVNVGEGAELGILSKVGDVQGAMGLMAEAPAFSVPPSREVARYAAQPAGQGFQMDYDRLAQAIVIAAASAVPIDNRIQVDGRTILKTMRRAEQEYGHRR